MRSSVKLLAIGCLLWGSGCIARTNRRAVFLDFQSQPTIEAAQNGSTPPIDPVRAAMLASMDSTPTQDTPRQSITEGLHIPSWMTGTSVLQPASLLAPLLSAGPCSVDYRPSARLSATQEKRRQLLLPLVARAACEAGLPVGLMDALVVQESRYNPLAISPKGAVGLTQLMRGTAQSLGANRYDLLGNLRGGATYLRQQLNEFKAPHLALAAYNAGPARVRIARGIPNITETRNYVSRILSEWSGMVTPGAGGTGSHSRRVTLHRF